MEGVAHQQPIWISVSEVSTGPGSAEIPGTLYLLP